MKRIAFAGVQILGALLLCGLAIYLMQVGIDTKWVVICGETLFFFGYVCYRTKDLWQDRRYWATFGGLLAVHCVAVFLLQRNRPMFPGIYYGFFGIVEGLLLLALFVVGFGGGR
jgi:hypothetical protein